MNKIYVATKLRAEDCDVFEVSVLAVGSYDDCKKAVRAEWEKYAEHDDIGEFDEEDQNEWYCTIEDKICYTLTFEIHCVDVNKGFGATTLEVLIEQFKEKYKILQEVKVPDEPITIRDREGFHASGENGYLSRLRINKDGRLEYYHDWWQYGWFDDDKYIPQKIEALKQVLK